MQTKLLVAVAKRLSMAAIGALAISGCFGAAAAPQIASTWKESQDSGALERHCADHPAGQWATRDGALVLDTRGKLSDKVCNTLIIRDGQSFAEKWRKVLEVSLEQAAVSPDGKYVATLDANSTLSLLDAATGEVIKTLEKVKSSASTKFATITFLPNHLVLAGASSVFGLPGLADAPEAQGFLPQDSRSHHDGFHNRSLALSGNGEVAVKTLCIQAANSSDSTLEISFLNSTTAEVIGTFSTKGKLRTAYCAGAPGVSEPSVSDDGSIVAFNDQYDVVRTFDRTGVKGELPRPTSRADSREWVVMGQHPYNLITLLNPNAGGIFAPHQVNVWNLDTTKGQFVEQDRKTVPMGSTAAVRVGDGEYVLRVWRNAVGGKDGFWSYHRAKLH